MAMVRSVITAFLVMGAFALPSSALADSPPSGENSGGDHADHPTRPCRAEGAPSNNSGPYRAEDCPDADVVCPAGMHRQEMEQVKLHGRAARVHRWSPWFRVANDDDGDDDHGDDGDDDNGRRHGHKGHKHKVVCVPDDDDDNPPVPAVTPVVTPKPTPVTAPVTAPAPVATNLTAPQQTPAQKKVAQKRKAARKRATQRARKQAARRPQLTG